MLAVAKQVPVRNVLGGNRLAHCGTDAYLRALKACYINNWLSQENAPLVIEDCAACSQSAANWKADFEAMTDQVTAGVQKVVTGNWLGHPSVGPASREFP